MTAPPGPVRTILIVANGFVPGFGGGSIRTIDHLRGRLGREFDVHVLTRNHDYTDRTPYAGIPVGQWVAGDGVTVRYERPWRRSPRHIAAVAGQIGADVVVVNSLFASGAIAALVARRLGLLRRPIVIAPEGELGAAARRQGRSVLKSVFLATTTRLGFYRDANWRAASADEAADIAAFAPRPRRIVTAPSPPPPTPALGQPPERTEPAAGTPLRLVFLSAIDGRKGAVRAAELVLATQDASLDLYGFVRDDAEHAALTSLIASDPAGRIRYHGAIDHARIPEAFGAYDAMVFPTEEEVLGYVVGEALLAGCPVLVSDRTPWRDLDACGAGRVLPLDDRAAWVAALDELSAMSAAERSAMRIAAFRRGRDWTTDDSALDAWRTLLTSADER